MPTGIHSVLHADHVHWREDIDMWRLDIEEWRKERAKLLAALEVALGAEASGLREHERSMCQHGEHLMEHERLIASLEQADRPGCNEIEARMAADHQKESENHAQMREVHERLKRDHHRAMARLAVVLKSLGREYGSGQTERPATP